MPRKGKKNKAHINKQLWDRSNSTDRTKWRSKSQKGYDFYLDEQLSMDEQKSLEESGMPSFTINRILPIIEIMKYFVTANNPRWKAVGATGDDTDIAQVHSDISDYCWHASNGNSIYGQVVLDSLVKGIGYFLVDVDQDSDHGKGEVVFSRIDPYDVFVDPSSRDFLFRDAAFIMIKKNLSKSQLKNLFPQHSAKINKITSNSDYSSSYSQRDLESSKIIQPEDVSFGLNPKGEEDQIIAYYENYSKIKVPFVNAFIRVPLTNEQEQQLKQSVDVQLQEFTTETSVQLQEKIMSIDQSLQSGEIIPERAELEVQKASKMMEVAIQEKQQELMSIAQEQMTKVEQVVIKKEEFDIMMQGSIFKKSVVDFVNFFETRIKLCCSVGDDVFLYEYELPITEYPIVPIPYLYTGTPYAMSAVMPLIGKQQEINKAHQIMIHNANLASNLRWLYEEGSVDESEWEQYSSSPGALLKYRQGFQPPTPVLPAPINNAFYTITQQGKSDAEYISGVPSAMMGFTQEQSETYRGLLANDEFGTRRLKSWMSTVVEPALEHLGNCFKMVAQSHYQIDKVFRIVQPEAGQEQTEDKEVRINIPIFNDYGKAIGKWMDYESSKFDVRIIAGATLPLNRWALLEEYFKWYQAGLIDDVAMIAETDIRNKKQLVDRKSVYSQLQSQVEQMTEAIKDNQGTIETLERQLVQAGIKMKVNEASQKVNKEMVTTEGQQKLLRSMMQGEFQMAKKELSRELKSVVEQAKIDTKKDFDASKEK
jgi:hypothetical protein|tara:strand:+ start:665 stop:2953 length:2289 start_codon:yes stop_codon:yes gene_type:complete